MFKETNESKEARETKEKNTGTFRPLPHSQETMRKRPYEDLIVWREAHQLCMDVHMLLSHFPSKERFELCSQIHRSAYSVPMNIVEGNMKRSKKERLRFLEYSEGSLEELDYQLLLSRDLKYITVEQFDTMRMKVGKVSYLLTKFRIGIETKK